MFVVLYRFKAASEADADAFQGMWVKAKLRHNDTCRDLDFRLSRGRSNQFLLHTRWSTREAWLAVVDADTSWSALLTERMVGLLEGISQVDPQVMQELVKPQHVPGGQESTGWFSVRVLEARDLTSKNMNGLSDPYCVLRMPRQRRQKTAVHAKTVNPRFNETFHFKRANHSNSVNDCLSIVVRSKDFFFKTQEIGRCRIDLRYYRDFDTPVWFPLLNTADKRSKDRGSLLLQLSMDVEPPESKAPERAVLWKDLKPQLETGDLVLFESRGIPSKIIRLYTASRYSHLGIIIRPRDIGIEGPDEPLVWEAHPNGHDYPDFEGVVKHGVILNFMEMKLLQASYKTCVVRRLIVRRTPEMLRGLREFYEEAKDLPYTPYDIRFAEIIRAGAGTGRLGRNEYHNEHMFCSGLVAEAYIRMAVLSNSLAGNNYNPADFEHLSLLHGFLTEEIPIYRSFNPITRTIDLEPARDLKTRYLMSRAVRAFQDGKRYKPSRALQMLGKSPQLPKRKTSEGTLTEGEESPPTPQLHKGTSDIQFEFETRGVEL